MKRRGFLKSLAGVATAAVVSEKLIPDDGVVLNSMAHPHVTPGPPANGFSLAQLKPEGATIPYDLTEASLEQACITIKKRGGILTRSEFSKQMADGLNKAFKDVYRDYEPGGWDDDNA